MLPGRLHVQAFVNVVRLSVALVYRFDLVEVSLSSWVSRGEAISPTPNSEGRGL